MFFGKKLNFYNQLFFATSPFVLKNQIKWKNMPVRCEAPSFALFASIAPKYETSAQKQNINTYYTRLRRNTCYEILINTFLRRDQVQFDLKFFHKKRTTQSFPSYFCICIFEGVPCTAKLPSFLVCWKDLDELFDYKIFALSSHYNWKKIESFRYQVPTECLSHSKRIYQTIISKTTFIAGHF